MNTRIYLNDKFIEFSDEHMQASQNQSFNALAPGEREKKLNKLLKNFIDEGEKDPVFISGLPFTEALEILKKSFYYIEAAGGFIEQQNKFLFIRRHNRWDLPKGKLEKDETVEEAAIRECEEECGIKNLNIIRPLPSTFHMYLYKKGYALKQSYWFYMQTDYAEKLVPQEEESITEVRWCTKEEIEAKILKDTYHTITDVTKQALKG